jgi:hypothetical protein
MHRVGLNNRKRFQIRLAESIIQGYTVMYFGDTGCGGGSYVGITASTRPDFPHFFLDQSPVLIGHVGGAQGRDLGLGDKLPAASRAAHFPLLSKALNMRSSLPYLLPLESKGQQKPHLLLYSFANDPTYQAKRTTEPARKASLPSGKRIPPSISRQSSSIIGRILPGLSRNPPRSSGSRQAGVENHIQNSTIRKQAPQGQSILPKHDAVKSDSRYTSQATVPMHR